MLAPFFKGESILYKDPANDVYIMALIQSQLTHADFNRVCNMLAEYSTAEKATGTAMAYLERTLRNNRSFSYHRESCDCIISISANVVFSKFPLPFLRMRKLFMFPYAFLWRELKLYSYNSIDSRMLGKSKKREESESIIKKQSPYCTHGTAFYILLYFRFYYLFAAILALIFSTSRSASIP